MSNISDEFRLAFQSETLEAADFSGRSLTQFVSSGSRFAQCSFERTIVESASFGAGRTTSEYIGCSFDGARLSMGPGGYARFIDCSFEDVRITNWFCFAVELIDCKFSGRLSKAVFNGRVPDDKRDVAGRSFNRFEGNDFRRAHLVDVAFRTGIDLAKQALPTNDDYVYLGDAPLAVRRARVAYNAWPDTVAKKLARGALVMMEEEVASGQQQLLIRPGDYPKSSRTAIRALLQAARGMGTVSEEG